MNEVAKKLAERLLGLTCNDIRLVEGGTLILYLVHRARADGGAKLWIDSAWRLAQNNVVLVGSLDNAETVLEHVRGLVARVITGVRVEGASHDIHIAFSEGYVLDTFCHSIDMELWELRSDDGYRLGVRERLEVVEYTGGYADEDS